MMFYDVLELMHTAGSVAHRTSRPLYLHKWSPSFGLLVKLAGEQVWYHQERMATEDITAADWEIYL